MDTDMRTPMRASSGDISMNRMMTGIIRTASMITGDLYGVKEAQKSAYMELPAE